MPGWVQRQATRDSETRKQQGKRRTGPLAGGGWVQRLVRRDERSDSGELSWHRKKMSVGVQEAFRVSIDDRARRLNHPHPYPLTSATRSSLAPIPPAPIPLSSGKKPTVAPTECSPPRTSNPKPRPRNLYPYQPAVQPGTARMKALDTLGRAWFAVLVWLGLWPFQDTVRLGRESRERGGMGRSRS